MSNDFYARSLEEQVAALEKENAELRKLAADLADQVASFASGPGPNTAMILGALESGGDVMGLARTLADRQAASDEKAKKTRKK